MKALSLILAATLVAAGANAPASAAEAVGAASVADQMTRVRILIRDPDVGPIGSNIRRPADALLVTPLPFP